MSVTPNSQRAGYLAAFLLSVLPVIGYGQAAVKPPLYLIEVKRDGAVDSLAIAAIKNRLQQIGENVLLLPDTPLTSCDNGQCVLRLARGIPALAQGRLLWASRGGQASWVDVVKGKVVNRTWTCQDGCEPDAALAREVALLVEKGPTAYADLPPGCVEQPAAPETADKVAMAEPVRSALQKGVSLQVTAKGVHAPLRQLAVELQRSLLEMGLPIIVLPIGARPTQNATTALPQLDIELAGEPGMPGSLVKTVAMTLQAQGQQRQLRFYCAKESCQSSLLAHLRLNLGVLLEEGNLPAQLTAGAHAAQVKCNPIPTLTGSVQASLKPVVPSPGTAADSAGEGSAAGSKCPRVSRNGFAALAAVGGALTAGGIASLSTGLAMRFPSCPFTLDGKVMNTACDLSQSSWPVGIGVGVPALAAGIVLLGVSIDGLKKHAHGCKP